MFGLFSFFGFGFHESRIFEKPGDIVLFRFLRLRNIKSATIAKRTAAAPPPAIAAICVLLSVGELEIGAAALVSAAGAVVVDDELRLEVVQVEKLELVVEAGVMVIEGVV